MNFFIAVVILAGLCAVVVAVVTAVALTLGAALAYLLPLSLFQATLLIIGATGASALTALALTIMCHLSIERIFYNSFRSRRPAPKKHGKTSPSMIKHNSNHEI